MPRAAAVRQDPQAQSGLFHFLPESLRFLENPQKDIPRIAKNAAMTAQIEEALPRIPTIHHLHRQDARQMRLEPNSIHLVVTSPPYWTLKKYNRSDGQLGYVAHYERFLAELDKVWQRCFEVLVPGGRLVC